MPNEKLKVGVIGANPTYGWSPRAHLPAIVALPDIELVAALSPHYPMHDIVTRVPTTCETLRRGGSG